MVHQNSVQRNKRKFLESEGITSPPTDGAAASLIAFINGSFGGKTDKIAKQKRVKYIIRIQDRYLKKNVITQNDDDNDKFGSIQSLFIPPDSVQEKNRDKIIEVNFLCKETIPTFLAMVKWDSKSLSSYFLKDLIPVKASSSFTQEIFEASLNEWQEKIGENPLFPILMEESHDIVKAFRIKFHTLLRELALVDFDPDIWEGTVILGMSEFIYKEIKKYFPERFIWAGHDYLLAKILMLTFRKKFMRPFNF